MAHKKHPIFIRVIANNKQVVCINPLQLSSFQIIEKAKIKNGDEVIEADTIKFFWATGNGLAYSVGKDVTQAEFNYICETLKEYLYLNEQEFRAKTAAIEAAKLQEWNDKMASPEVDAVAPAEPTVA